MSQNIVVNGATYTDVDEIQIPKSGGGYATFVDSSNLTSRLNVAQIFAVTATTINDINGEVNGELGAKVLYDNDIIESIIFPAVTGVKDNGVTGCANLRYAKMDSCGFINYRGFRDCPKLEEIDFPSLTTIGQEAFYRCYALTTCNLPLLQTVGGSAFAECTSLQSISLPSVTSVSDYGFNYCTALTNVNLPEVVNFGVQGFSNCTSLQSITLPKAETSARDMFTGCSSLQRIELPKMRLMYNGYHFRGCTSLTTLIMGKTDGVCSIENVNSFTDTPIASGTGFIYVPDNLVSSYQSANVWSTYASQIKGISELPQA